MKKSRKVKEGMNNGKFTKDNQAGAYVQGNEQAAAQIMESTARQKGRFTFVPRQRRFWKGGVTNGYYVRIDRRLYDGA